MHSSSHKRSFIFVLACVLALFGSVRGQAEAALLMEEPYGFFGEINPTGHTALYFAKICAESPVKLRRCMPGEEGVVIARYQGIAGYDWVAMPLIPYLYSVEDASDVPARVNRETVLRLRKLYHERHMGSLGADVFEGNLVRGGWTQLVGVSYERRIYAFRFATTEAQDDALIARMNDRPNRSEFDLIYNNCADFARSVMNHYFPKTFKRNFFPDVGMTTPKQVTYRLLHYARKHPDLQLTVFEIPQIPGYRRMSHSNKSVAASLITTGYAIPITLLNPYLAGGIFVDYLARGRYPLVPKHPVVLAPDQMSKLSGERQVAPVPAEPEIQASFGFSVTSPGIASPAPEPGLKEILGTNE